MKQYLPLTDVEREYKKVIEDLISGNSKLTVDQVVQLSVQLFNDIKVPGVSDSPDTSNDMLLFQYGTNDWGDEKGLHSNFDITRQFIVQGDDEEVDTEFYQLSFSLIYEPTILKEEDHYDSWSNKFKDLQDWVTNIKSTAGYLKLNSSEYRSYSLSFFRV